jgi:hypothetical protein
MNKASARTDVVAVATKQTNADRVALNGAILCSKKGCLETATITLFFVTGRVTKYCKYHTEQKGGFFPIYAIAEHDTIYGDKSKAGR